MPLYLAPPSFARSLAEMLVTGVPGELGARLPKVSAGGGGPARQNVQHMQDAPPSQTG
jgi:hypothetical protein